MSSAALTAHVEALSGYLGGIRQTLGAVLPDPDERRVIIDSLVEADPDLNRRGPTFIAAFRRRFADMMARRRSRGDDTVSAVMALFVALAGAGGGSPPPGPMRHRTLPSGRRPGARPPASGQRIYVAECDDARRLANRFARLTDALDRSITPTSR